MSKLFIHIGTWKTGSSTIQYNLYTQRDKLENEGFYYLCKENKMVVNDGIVRGFIKLEEDFIEQSRNKLKAIVDKTDGHKQNLNYISSAEEYSGNPFEGFRNAPVVAQNLFEITKDLGFDVYIIVYLRRQDDFFESLYQQSIRLGESHHFHDFLTKFDFKTDFDWYNLIQGYADQFGQEKIIVRRYHKKFLPEKNSLIQDFGRVIGSTFLSNFDTTISKNKGFSRDTMEITRIMNKYFEGEERFKLRKIFDRVNAKLPFEKYAFFSNEERVEFLNQFRESNSAVSRHYLDKETLFPEPNLDIKKANYTGLTIEAVVANFSKALLIVKEDDEKQKRKLAYDLKSKFIRFRMKRLISKKLQLFPGLKSSIKKRFGY